MVLGSKKKKEEEEQEGRKLADLLNDLIGIEIDNRKIQDANQKKVAEMHDKISKLAEGQREANEQILDALGRVEGALRKIGTAEAKAEEAPAEAEPRPEEAEQEEPPAEKAKEGKEEGDVLKRLRELREKGG